MPKKKVREKSVSPNKATSSLTASKGPTQLVIDLTIFSAVLVVLGAMYFTLEISPYSISPDVSEHQSANSFAHLKIVGPWVNDRINASYEEIDVELSDKISSWNDIGYFSHSEKISLAPGRYKSSLNSRVLSALGLINPWQSFSSTDRVLGFRLDTNQIYFDLNNELASKINRQSYDAELIIENGRAATFQPHLVGRSLDLVSAGLRITNSLFQNKTEAELPVTTTQPQIILSETNNLGIDELVALGESNFVGSSASRITNIRVGSEKFNGVILTPGEEFSFNNNLGPVTAAEGFKPELVIKSTGTIPELGGGLCQVSTTAFRAALYGGLNITARKNHSYAVSYYSPQGTDATIYPGVVDFKFKNDTSGHLLIWTRMEGTKLYFEFYGTKDERQVTIDGPYQYDFRADGAMKARLTRVVDINGQEKEDTFYSNYVSKNLFPTIYEYPDPPAPTAPTPAANTDGSLPPSTVTNPSET